jgi:hypothetical protein
VKVVHAGGVAADLGLPKPLCRYDEGILANQAKQ